MRSDKESAPAYRLFSANLAWIATGCLLAGTPALMAQEGRTGVSVPQPVLSDSSNAQPAVPAKPSAAIPMQPAAPASPAYGPYVPYKGSGAGGGAAATQEGSAPGFDPDGNIVTPETAHGRRLLSRSGEASEESTDVDAGIVTHVPTRPGEINDGTLIKARLKETLSTMSTQPGSNFSAEVSEPVMQEGRVYIPAGSVVEGRVTWVSYGKRIGGRAAIHIEPQRVTLPDGTEYKIHARVIDTSSWGNTAVDREGTIIRKDNAKGTLGVGGLTAGGGMAAGAMVAGPVGALVGAGVGAGVTAIVWTKQDRQATLPKDLGVIFSLTAPLSVEPARAVDSHRATGVPAGE